MKYLCLVFYDEKQRNSLSEDESQALINESLNFDRDARGSGHLLAAHPLEQVSTAKTVRVQNGNVLVTDGPFAETKEQIAGFVLLEAKDFDEAVSLASLIPPARLGGVEVRPIIERPILGHWKNTPER